MLLIDRYKSYTETIEEMEKAAVARHSEGMALVRANQLDGGVYLLGYTAEILLKTAYSRIDPRVNRRYPISSRIEPARQRWQTIWGGPKPSGHDLLFLSLSIEDERVVQGKGAFNIAFARSFNETINRIAGKWYVEMRYRRKEATTIEANEMVEDVLWLRSNYRAIWR